MIYDNSFYEVQKYVNQTNHVYSTIFNLLSVDIWNGLSEDQQNIITETSNEMQDWTNEYYFAHKDEYLEKLKEERHDARHRGVPEEPAGRFVDHLSGNLRSVQQLNRPFKKVHFHLTVLQ